MMNLFNKNDEKKKETTLDKAVKISAIVVMLVTTVASVFSAWIASKSYSDVCGWFTTKE